MAKLKLVGKLGEELHVRDFRDLLPVHFRRVRLAGTCFDFVKLLVVWMLGESEWAQIRDKDLKVRVSPRTVP